MHVPAHPCRQVLRNGAKQCVRAATFALSAVVWLGAVAGLAMHPAAQAADAPEQQNAPVAVGSGPLDLEIVVETLVVEVGPAGTETRRWFPAGRLRAGDDVHYTVRVTNPGKEPVTDISVTKRMPFGVSYIRGSAVGPACTVQFSIDGGLTFAETAQLEAARAKAASSNKRAPRKVSPSEYTHVRWILNKPLPPNSTALLRFRATFT